MNKKGVFALGLVIGIISVLFFSKIVFAEETTLPGDMVQICYIPDGYELYVHASDFDITKMAWGKNNGSDYSWYYVGPNLSEVYYRNGPDKPWRVHYNLNNLSMTPYTDVPITCGSLYVFNSLGEAQAYVNGEIDASSALNYDDVQNNSKIFDASIPSLDFLKYDTITDKGFIASFGFNDADSFTNYVDYNNSDVMYDIQVVHFYSEYEGLSRFEQLMSKGISNVNKWVANTFGSGNPIDDEMALSKVQAVYDSNGLIKTDLCPTVDSYNKSNNNGLLLFTVTVNGSDVLSVSNSVTYKVDSYDNLVYVGSQTCITPYVIFNGQKYFGNSIYYQGFNTTGYQEYYGTPSNIIGTFDDLGDYTTINSNNASSIGNATDSFTSDSLLSYFQNGFGLLGNNGFLALARETFSFFPTEIWVLIFFGISVSIVLIVARFGRGL